MKAHYGSDYEKPLKHSEAGQIKCLKQTLNSNNAFVLLVLMSYMESRLNLLLLSWYKSMKSFRTNIKLVKGKYLCVMHDSFLGVDSSYNDIMLSGMSK